MNPHIKFWCSLLVVIGIFVLGIGVGFGAGVRIEHSKQKAGSEELFNTLAERAIVETEPLMSFDTVCVQSLSKNEYELGGRDPKLIIHSDVILKNGDIYTKPEAFLNITDIKETKFIAGRSYRINIIEIKK